MKNHGAKMRVEIRLFLWMGLLFLPITAVYGYMTKFHEPVGVVGLLLTALMLSMVGGYLMYTAAHIDNRPEDDTYGEIAQGAGEQGFFPPYSWWPLPLAFAGAVMFAGLAVGWWLFFVGVPIFVLSTIGWVFEYYRGAHAH